MKILHTSDWHLGRSLYGRQRYAEFQAFLDWLVNTIEREQVNVLLVAGDIFDTTVPSNRAQELYYRFLYQIADKPCCRHVVIIAGNHDSPTFLDAPRELLRVLNVHVVGQANPTAEHDVLVLRTPEGHPELLVCAVPYLRDSDLRTAQPGETLDDKGRKLIEGLRLHYQRAATYAQELRNSLGDIPVIAMGHLFTAGGLTTDDDGVRELYVGSLAHVSPALFSNTFDYVALGHLHVPQRVGGQEHIRYCGSPLPMGFGEATQQKQLCQITFTGRRPDISSLAIPCFQVLRRLQGDLPMLIDAIRQMAEREPNAWLEILYTGHDRQPNLRDHVEAALSGTALEVLKLSNQRIRQHALSKEMALDALDTLQPDEVFERCLVHYDVPIEQRPALRDGFREILMRLNETDHNAD